MKRKIVLPKEQRVRIAKLEGISIRTVNYALSYSRDSSLSKRIRILALSMGGRLIETNDITPLQSDDIFIENKMNKE